MRCWPSAPFITCCPSTSGARRPARIGRVLEPGGLALVAFIPRLSGIAGLLERAASNPEQVPPGALTRAAATGVFRNPSRRGFQEGYFPTPDELSELFESIGFTLVEIVSLQSVANRLEPILGGIQGSVQPEVGRVLDEVARDPAVVATGGHAVLVARKMV